MLPSYGVLLLTALWLVLATAFIAVLSWLFDASFAKSVLLVLLYLIGAVFLGKLFVGDFLSAIRKTPKEEIRSWAGRVSILGVLIISGLIIHDSMLSHISHGADEGEPQQQSLSSSDRRASNRDTWLSAEAKVFGPVAAFLGNLVVLGISITGANPGQARRS